MVPRRHGEAVESLQGGRTRYRREGQRSLLILVCIDQGVLSNAEEPRCRVFTSSVATGRWLPDG